MTKGKIINNIISVSVFFAGILFISCLVYIFNTVFLSKDFFIIVLILLLCIFVFYIHKIASEKEILSECIYRLKREYLQEEEKIKAREKENKELVNKCYHDIDNIINIMMKDISNKPTILKLRSNSIKVFSIVYSELKEEYNRRIRFLEKKYQEANDSLKKECDNLKKDLEEKYQNEKQQMFEILENEFPFSKVSSLYADVVTVVFKENAFFLKNKKHPAISASEVVSAMKAETRKYIIAYKEMIYKYELLLNTFPELKRYVDNEEELINLANYEDYDDFDLRRDKTLDFLTEDEWMKLSINERNQLALDRYKKRKKSNWVIGIEYEMYIDYLLRENGFSTIPFGSLKGLEDLGRDIIAKKMNNKGEMVTYIIQCKNWSVNKEIHENTVCQLFGTAIEYDIQNKRMFQKTIPVLYTTTKLSDKAMEFAKRLGVTVIVASKGEYPMIKCNINDGNKIYHLPFDQQYYRTQIVQPGEFYAWTVEEAVKAGFRRAFKYMS